MARRNRRRSRPRHQQLRSDQISISSPVISQWQSPAYANKLSSRSSARYWHTQWESWQTRRQLAPGAQLKSRGQAEPSVQANADIVRHRLQLFGGDEHDGTTLCAPMLQVVMNLFDGGLDYADP